MKPRTVKTKINQLVKVFGTRKAVAEKLGVTERYIYDLQNNRIPGKHLYRYICELTKD